MMQDTDPEAPDYVQPVHIVSHYPRYDESEAGRLRFKFDFCIMIGWIVLITLGYLGVA